MVTAVETLEKLERRITIAVPLVDVQTEVEKRLKQRAKTAKAPGFRPGKVPMKMVAAQYGYQVENEVGPDHDKQFEVSVRLDGRVLASGQGRSKKSAEQDAARKALEQFK